MSKISLGNVLIQSEYITNEDKILKIFSTFAAEKRDPKFTECLDSFKNTKWTYVNLILYNSMVIEDALAVIYLEKESRYPGNIIENTWKKIIKKIQGSHLYGIPIDMNNEKMLLVAAYSEGRKEQQEEDYRQLMNSPFFTTKKDHNK